MNINEALETHTKAVKKLRAFEEEHKEVLETQKVLAEAIVATEAELKTAAREYGQDIENKVVKVKVSKKWKKYYDFDIIKKQANSIEIDEIMKKAVSISVNKDEFELLVSEQKVRPKIMHSAFKEEEMTSAVTVSVKGSEDEK